MNKTALAARRAQLIDRCAEQRVNLAVELQALSTPQHAMHPLVGQVLARVLEHKRLALGVLGTVLGLAVTRPARLLRAAGLLASGWRMARNGMALVARYRG